MDKDIVIIADDPLLRSIGKSIARPDGNWVITPREPTVEYPTGRRSSVAKDRRLARKKRAKKLARRR